MTRDNTATRQNRPAGPVKITQHFNAAKKLWKRLPSVHNPQKRILY